MKRLPIFALACLVAACSSNDTQIADNTFIRGSKVYKLIDNEVREIGEVNGDVKKFEALKPKQRDFGTFTMDFVQRGASANLKALYRGNFLYYNLKVTGMNEMLTRNMFGRLTIKFVDEYGFVLHEVPVSVNEMTSIVNDDGSTDHYSYSGKRR